MLSTLQLFCCIQVILEPIVENIYTVILFLWGFLSLIQLSHIFWFCTPRQREKSIIAVLYPIENKLQYTQLIFVDIIYYQNTTLNAPSGDFQEGEYRI